MNKNFIIDETLCISCGKCLAECGHHVQIHSTTIDPENPACTRCYHCYTICPQGAIQPLLDKPTQRQETQKQTTPEELLGLFDMRRSIRKYENQPLETAEIERLLDAARYIPSGGNAHSYEFTVVQPGQTRDRLMAELTEIYRRRSMLLNSFILRNLAKPFVDRLSRGFLSDAGYRKRMKELLVRVERGDDPFFYFAPVVVLIHSRVKIPTPKEDCVLSGYNIALMAHAMGLGACFVTLAQNAINSSGKCKRILGLTELESVHAVLTLGHPAVKHLRVAPKPEKKINWR